MKVICNVDRGNPPLIELVITYDVMNLSSS